VRDLLNMFTTEHTEAMPFALTIVAERLKTPWQLIRLATKLASTKNAADIAATPYAIAVSMVLDQLDEKRLALRHALKNNHILIARDILIDIYDIEYALQVRIDLLEESEWGAAAGQSDGGGSGALGGRGAYHPYAPPACPRVAEVAQARYPDWAPDLRSLEGPRCLG
jgi:hypothetical protein